MLSNTTTLAFASPVRIDNFSPKEKAEASAFAQQVYDQCFEEGAFSKEELAFYLEDLGIWTQSDEEEYLKGFEDVQSMKVDYYDNFSLPTKRDKIKSAIIRRMEQVNESFYDKSYLHDYTCEAARDEAYGVHLFKGSELPLLFYRKFQAAKLPEETIRSLYFDPTWRMVWSVSKDSQSIFGVTVNWLNDNQLSLLYWSKLYDNILESMEAPANSVMHDSIAVDGWLIKQSKKRDAEDRKKALPTKESGEVFIPVSSRKEIKEINDLNNAEGKKILKSRARDLAANGVLDERQFSHVKQEIGIKKNELSFRGK